MIKVIINEQHRLKDAQISQLDMLAEKVNCGWSRLDVPATGWTAQEQYDIAQNLARSTTKTVIFASPLPYMIKLLTMAWTANESEVNVFVFHNDCRDKKELPGGKIVYVVAEMGWELL